MAYDAKAIEVMIASPSDVPKERAMVREVLVEWNAVHSRQRGLVLLPVGWDTHAAPDLSGPPQQMINERVLANADVLVGIFWTKIGSPTGKAISGSVEEIQEHRAKGKPVMLYFSSQPAALDMVDPDQYAKLKGFKEWAQGEGLVAFFDDADDFRAKFSRGLQLNLNDNSYLAGLAKPVSKNGQAPIDVPTLSEECRALLKAAAEGQSHFIHIRRSMVGTHVVSGNTDFALGVDKRTSARWEAATQKLYELGLLRDVNGQMELFELNHAGFEAADAIGV